MTTTELDGDSVGAIVALALAIGQKWPSKTVRVVTHETLPRRYCILVPEQVVFLDAARTPVEAVDLSIVLDGDCQRLGSAASHYEASAVKGIIDHHASNVNSAVDVELHDPLAASATELVMRLCDEWKVVLDRDMAGAIYGGMIFDTSVFRYGLTRPNTLRLAARLMETGIDHIKIVETILMEQPADKLRLRGRMVDGMSLEENGAIAWSFLAQGVVGKVETGGLVDDLIFVEGVEMAMLFVQRGPTELKLSLRSRGAVDVSAFAQSLNPTGGGHVKSAGVTLRGNCADAVRNGVEAAVAFVSGKS